MQRTTANLITLIALVVLPWWCVVMLLLLFTYLFDFFEIMFFGLLLDILYAVPGGFISSHIFLLSALVVYTASSVIRPNLRTV